MDVTPYLEPNIAPLAVFDSLPTRGPRTRFVVGDARVTWNDFAASIRRDACFLRAHVKPGDRACVFASNSVDWISAALAIQAAGGVMVPIYPASTADQAAYVVDHADAKVVYVDAALLPRVFAAWDRYSKLERVVVITQASHAIERRERVISLEEARAEGDARDREDPAAFERIMRGVSLDAFGMMLYTSGTSGNPKGVPLTHRNVAINGADWLRCYGELVEEDMVDLLWLPMSHVFGFGEACLGNTLGFTSHLVDPRSVVAALPDVKPHVFMSVPSVWEKLAQLADARGGDPKASLDAVTGGRLAFCLSGGAGLKREVKERFHAAGRTIFEGYGLTECSPTLTLNRPGAVRFDAVGKPLPSVTLKLADDGEILAKGPSVFSGYHKDAPATREAFDDDGWFKTGDVGRFTDDGFLQIVDRKKDILVTAGGKNVPPANIEAHFADDPLIAHAVVYGDGKRYLVAAIWPEENGARAFGDDATLRARVQAKVDAVNEKVAHHETIKKIAIVRRPLTVEGGLLTATLKVRRKKVYEAFREDFEALYREPRS